MIGDVHPVRTPRLNDVHSQLLNFYSLDFLRFCSGSVGITMYLMGLAWRQINFALDKADPPRWPSQIDFSFESIVKNSCRCSMTSFRVVFCLFNCPFLDLFMYFNSFPVVYLSLDISSTITNRQNIISKITRPVGFIIFTCIIGIVPLWCNNTNCTVGSNGNHHVLMR